MPYVRVPVPLLSQKDGVPTQTGVIPLSVSFKNVDANFPTKACREFLAGVQEFGGSFTLQKKGGNGRAEPSSIPVSSALAAPDATVVLDLIRNSEQGDLAPGTENLTEDVFGSSYMQQMLHGQLRSMVDEGLRRAQFGDANRPRAPGTHFADEHRHSGARKCVILLTGDLSTDVSNVLFHMQKETYGLVKERPVVQRESTTHLLRRLALYATARHYVINTPNIRGADIPVNDMCAMLVWKASGNDIATMVCAEGGTVLHRLRRAILGAQPKSTRLRAARQLNLEEPVAEAYVNSFDGYNAVLTGYAASNAKQTGSHMGPLMGPEFSASTTDPNPIVCILYVCRDEIVAAFLQILRDCAPNPHLITNADKEQAGTAATIQVLTKLLGKNPGLLRAIGQSGDGDASIIQQVQACAEEKGVGVEGLQGLLDRLAVGDALAEEACVRGEGAKKKKRV